MLHPSFYAGWERLDRREKAELIELCEAIAEKEDELRVLRSHRATILQRARTRKFRLETATELEQDAGVG